MSSLPNIVVQWKERVLQTARSHKDHLAQLFHNPETSEAPKSRAKRPHPTDLDEEHRKRLNEISRDNIRQAKKGIDSSLELVCRCWRFSRDKEKTKTEVRAANNNLKEVLTGVMDRQTEEAIAYIDTICSDQQQAAADYWETVSGRAVDFARLVIQAASLASRKAMEVLAELREVDNKMQDTVRKGYDNAVQS